VAAEEEEEEAERGHGYGSLAAFARRRRGTVILPFVSLSGFRAVMLQ
jgi:hypothetical protein